MFFFFNRRLRRIGKRQQEELLKQELKADFVEAELKALRSQMNPHFIFNALNSIQALILKSELESSYDYLVLFSKLVRKTLNYSNEEFISLEAEIDFLRIYLSLEKLRFDDFNFTLEINGDEDVYLPSLTIQPFIENALLHGLQHKADDKKIAIRFEVDEYFIKCVVEDNGIGRKASAEINERLGKEHKSFALKSIEKRLSMYHEEFGDKIGVKITDLEENGKSVGTKVDLILPLKVMY
jgi:LytS/YehU family sensor histidine kinase